MQQTVIYIFQCFSGEMLLGNAVLGSVFGPPSCPHKEWALGLERFLTKR